jgi:thiol:disulfide interchange protein DsbD
LDFTAEWCLTCHVNENTVLDSNPVVEKLKALNVVTMQADWTLQDRQITALLNKFGRSGVPLYVIFPADKASEPIVLPEVITQGIVLEKLDQAGPSK